MTAKLGRIPIQFEARIKMKSVKIKGTKGFPSFLPRVLSVKSEVRNGEKNKWLHKIADSSGSG